MSESSWVGLDSWKFLGTGEVYVTLHWANEACRLVALVDCCVRSSDHLPSSQRILSE